MPASSNTGARRARIEDVAAAANVSVATVSRALRNLPNVAESTRQRVVEIARELDYRPDPAAARLATGRSRTVTVVVPHLSSWYFSTVVAGAEAVCAETGYECLVLGVNTIEQCTRLLDASSHLERRTDGVVLVNIPARPEQAVSLRSRGIALVTVGTQTPGFPAVLIDDVRAGGMAAAHLVGLGHRHIGLISGQHDDPMNFAVPRLRRQGFADGLRAAGVELREDAVESGNFGIDGGQEAMAALLEGPEPPTAVFAMSDEMAFGGLLEFSERGLRAGIDVSLIGVDDHDVSRVLGLTTIRQRVSGQGAAAVRALVTLLATGEVEVATIDSPLELVVRSTTGPPVV
jgi:DNA-binding LacI/PurR family transcriptional regulator